MESPFDDEEVRAMFEQMGVAHKPGMAAELMYELGPLLAAEGIDLDNLDSSSVEDINAALANATERYNLELFTPTGDDLAGALEVLNECAEAIGDGDTGLAGLILDAVRSEPTGGLARRVACDWCGSWPAGYFGRVPGVSEGFYLREVAQMGLASYQGCEGDPAASPPREGFREYR